MLNSIVHIESSDKHNRSFGTGFVIDKDDYGAYILTCQHVVAEVQSPTVNDKAGEIIATSEFLDMAVLHVEGLHLQPLPLQVTRCHQNDVHAIGFSEFSQGMVQKKEIQATLFDEIIELHSKEDDAFYIVRRLKAEEDYRFDKGNSGAPLICEATGEVIAMISHKGKSNFAYAIEIASLKEIWRDLNQELVIQGTLHSHQHFYDNIQAFTHKLKEHAKTSHQKLTKHTTRLYDMDELQKELKDLKEEIQTKSKFKYFFLGIVSVIIVLTGYWIFSVPKPYVSENYRVVNISENDILNIRDGKGTVYPILDVIPFDATNIAVSSCESNDAGKEWCYVTYGSISGWVRSKYIEKEPSNFDHINASDTSSYKISNDNLFLQFTYSPSVKPGETMLITARLQNNGNSENQGGVTLSFPQRPILDWKVDYSDFETIKQYRIFDTIYNNHPDQDKAMRAIHPIIESFSTQWNSNQEHVFALSIVAPKDLTVFRIRVRASLTTNRVVPALGTIDQQAFQSEEIIIRIKE